MQYSNKSLIANALKSSVFEKAVLETYLNTTTYRRKKSFLETIKRTSELMRYFCPMSTLTTCQHRNFRELSLLQLGHAIAETKNEKILNYFKMIQGYFLFTPVNRGQLQRMINNKEVRIFKNLLSGEYTKEEVIQFLRIVLLFGDKDFRHCDEVKSILRQVCKSISA